MSEPRILLPHELYTPPEARLWVQTITPDIKATCQLLAMRAQRMILAIKQRNPQMLDPEPLQLTMDFALVYARRGLRLRELLEASDLDFLGDLVTILSALAQGDNRVACRFPDDVHLKFATKRNA